MHNCYLANRRALQKEAKTQKCDIAALQTRWLHERFLWRLQQVAPARIWALKGAMLLPTWVGAQARFSPNLNLQHQGPGPRVLPRQIAEDLSAACMVQVADGLEFDANSLEYSAAPGPYSHQAQGVCVAVTFGRRPHRMRLGVDRPAAPQLGAPALQLRTTGSPSDLKVAAITPEIFFAEKLHILSEASQPGAAPFGRMQDIDDMQQVLLHCNLRGSRLSKSIQSVFERRQSVAAPAMPRLVDPTSAPDAPLGAMWRHYSRGRGIQPPQSLTDVCQMLFAALAPLFDTMARNHAFMATWDAPGPWFLGE